MIPLWCIPIAVITGNCIIVKPSERDPTAVLILAELAVKAGFPPGVINVIHGGPPTVDFIIDEPAIKAVSFVGSNRAGEYIYNRCSEQGKRVQANLGAKNHATVLPDCNKDHFISAIVGAAFGAAGQRCMALSTLVLVGDTQGWLPDIVKQAKALSLNAGFEPGADLGPVITPQSKSRIESIIASAEAEGATILLDGRGVKPAKYPNGNWVSKDKHQIWPILFHEILTGRLRGTGWTNDYCECNTRYALLQGRDIWSRASLPQRIEPQ